MNLYSALQVQNGLQPTPLPRSARDVNANENNQIGVVNANAQANLNLSVFNSGGAAAGTSLVGAGTAAAFTTTTTTTATGVIAGTAGTGTGITATAGAAAGAGTAGTVTTTVTSVSWIPVAGQVIAIAAAVVGVIQMIDTADKQKRWQMAIENKQDQIKLIQQEIAIDSQVAQYSIQLLRDEIAIREDILKTNRILLVGSIVAVTVSGMILLYLINKKKI